MTGKKTVITSGSRKRAIARAVLRAGTGKIRVNHVFLSNCLPEIARLKIMEPVILSEGIVDAVDVDVTVHGGGVMSQADAVRLALARGFVEYTKSDKLKKTYLDYDRHLLVADVRRREMCKPNDSKARAARQKSYR